MPLERRWAALLRMATPEVRLWIGNVTSLQYLCFSRSSGITTSPLCRETELHALVANYFDRGVPLSFETRFLRIVGEALDTQPACPAQ